MHECSLPIHHAVAIGGKKGDCGGNPGPKDDREDHADTQRRAKGEGHRDVRQVWTQRGRHHSGARLPQFFGKEGRGFIRDNRITAVSQPMEPGASALFAKPLTSTSFSNGCKLC